MKLAVLSESPADEAAVRVLVEGLLGEPVDVSSRPRRRAAGVQSVFRMLPAVIRYLHYQTLADGVVVAVDSDRSPVHEESHEESPDEECRRCRIHAVVNPVCARLASGELDRPPIRVLAGLAVPSIEARFVTGRDPGAGGAAFQASPRSVRQLKRALYGSHRSSLEMEVEVMTHEAQRIVREGKLGTVESLFPGGFGSPARALRR